MDLNWRREALADGEENEESRRDRATLDSQPFLKPG